VWPFFQRLIRVYGEVVGKFVVTVGLLNESPDWFSINEELEIAASVRILR